MQKAIHLAAMTMFCSCHHIYVLERYQLIENFTLIAHLLYFMSPHLSTSPSPYTSVLTVYA